MSELNVKKMSPQFLVTNIEESLKYYSDKLGFSVEFFYEGFYAGILKNGQSIHLKSGKPSREERQNKRENGDLDIIFSVENVRELFDELSDKSIDIVQPLCDRPYGTEFYIADPDGYILAFLEES
jgi:uncharacterized glyoxalase superfamily protein PhnB